MTAPFAAILVAAGSSRRMGDDKLWTDFWGRPTWRWGLDVLLASPGLVKVAITVPADAIERFREALPPTGAERCLVVAGGEVRADSVIAGIWALTRAGHDDETLVLVHDAARPAVTPELVALVVNAVAAGGERAVVPVIPLVDSLKRVRGGRVVAPVEREDVVAAQTPQAAPLGALRAAIEEAHAWGRPITDDAGALAAAGVPVHTVPGDPGNRKLTLSGDLAPMRAVLAERVVALGAPHGVDGGRVGIGFDAHRLMEGRPMRLGGLTWNDEPRGPLGHSDGDAALHALTDALLSAARLRDIGAHFSAGTTPEGADSAQLLERAVSLLAEHGWRPLNVDLVVAVARPVIAERRDELAARIADLLAISATAVSIKGTTSDGLGFAGQEGVAAWAVAAVERTA
ncbi:MAG: 2-C-methyl-D-erythritol 2,4-cyclodiphosphate synthase [Candidatus Limnocylindria bacterium]